MICIKCDKRKAFRENKKSKGGDGLCNPCRQSKEAKKKKL